MKQIARDALGRVLAVTLGGLIIMATAGCGPRWAVTPAAPDAPSSRPLRIAVMPLVESRVSGPSSDFDPGILLIPLVFYTGGARDMILGHDLGDGAEVPDFGLRLSYAICDAVIAADPKAVIALDPDDPTAADLRIIPRVTRARETEGMSTYGLSFIGLVISCGTCLPSRWISGEVAITCDIEDAWGRHLASVTGEGSGTSYGTPIFFDHENIGGIVHAVESALRPLPPRVAVLCDRAAPEADTARLWREHIDPDLAALSARVATLEPQLQSVAKRTIHLRSMLLDVLRADEELREQHRQYWQRRRFEQCCDAEYTRRSRQDAQFRDLYIDSAFGQVTRLFGGDLVRIIAANETDAILAKTETVRDLYRRLRTPDDAGGGEVAVLGGDERRQQVSQKPRDILPEPLYPVLEALAKVEGNGREYRVKWLNVYHQCVPSMADVLEHRHLPTGWGSD